MVDAVVDPPAAFELTTPAEPAAVARIRSAVRQFAAAHGADQHVLVSIALAVSEAATNAVLHAFVGREPGVITAVARAGSDELVVRIIDNGRGMQPRTDSPGLGIGLPTMGQMSRSLDIRPAAEGGTDVCMTFDVPGVRGAPQPDFGPGDERTRLLVEVTRLAGGSGWPVEGVDALVELLAPAVVDVCAVDVVAADGTPHRLAARVPGEPALSRWLAQRAPQARYATSPTYGALDDVSSQTVELTDELLRAAATETDDLAAMRRLPVRWWVTVPLREGDRAHGLLHVGFSDARGRPSAGDVAFFELLAERATRGLANTKLLNDLRRTRHRLEHILGALAEAVIVHDAGGQIVYANEAAGRVLRADDVREVVASAPGELSGRFRFLREDGSVLAREDLPGQRLVAGRSAPPLLMRSVHLASGQERWLLTRGSILDEDGPLAVNIIEDVTDAKVAEHRHAFLAQASALLIGPVDDARLQRLADLAVEHLADWCAIDLHGRRVATASRGPGLESAEDAAVVAPLGTSGTITLAAGTIARSLDESDREFVADVAARVDNALARG